MALAADGWDVATSHWGAYDERMPWGSDPDLGEVHDEIADQGVRAISIEANLEDPEVVARLFDDVEADLGAVTALVLSHAESVDSSIRDTTVESFDRHFAVNARASWLLIKEFANRFPGPHGAGRIVALTSDHTAHNLPYGASKGALDRIVIAAARELSDLGVSCNLVNPGPIDTGWMTPDVVDAITGATPLGRLGTGRDIAQVVAFLCSRAGGWVNGQLIHANGGFAGI